jgi:transcriptional regulator with XRE-family HTH domain
MEKLVRDTLASRLRTQSLYSIARDAGVNLSSLSRWHRGERSICLVSFLRLVDYLGLELVEAGQDETSEPEYEYAPWEST